MVIQHSKCIKISLFSDITRIGHGNYGSIYQGTLINKDTNTSGDTADNNYCIKKLSPTLIFDTNGFNILYLREINILKSIKHRNIINIIDIAVGNNINNIYIIMELMQIDLKELLKRSNNNNNNINIFYQIVKGLEYLHHNKIIHRDLKPSNILIKNGIVKIADFGISRRMAENSILSPLVVTLWYRPPEVLLSSEYSYSLDIWSLGCIFYELQYKEVLFQAKSEIEQLRNIFNILGYPVEGEFTGSKVSMFYRNKDNIIENNNIKDRIIKDRILKNTIIRDRRKRSTCKDILKELEGIEDKEEEINLLVLSVLKD